MKIKLTRDWTATCGIEFVFKGQEFEGEWSPEYGYTVYRWCGPTDLHLRLTEDEREELTNILREVDTPVLRFNNGSYELKVTKEV